MKIINKEIQFIIPISLCILLFFIANIFGLLNISDLSYGSSSLLNEPHRILSYNFVHKDFNHLLSNLFGIIVIRYSFIKLNLHSKFLFLYLIILIIIIQTLYLFLVDNFLFYNYNHFLVGFSGIIFGSYSFILLSSLYGKKYLFNFFIGLKKNYEINKLMVIFLSLGILYSFLPAISLSGHIAGILSGCIIFLL